MPAPSRSGIRAPTLRIATTIPEKSPRTTPAPDIPRSKAYRGTNARNPAIPQMVANSTTPGRRPAGWMSACRSCAGVLVGGSHRGEPERQHHRRRSQPDRDEPGSTESDVRDDDLADERADADPDIERQRGDAHRLAASLGGREIHVRAQRANEEQSVSHAGQESQRDEGWDSSSAIRYPPTESENSAAPDTMRIRRPRRSANRPAKGRRKNAERLKAPTTRPTATFAAAERSGDEAGQRGKEHAVRAEVGELGDHHQDERRREAVSGLPQAASPRPGLVSQRRGCASSVPPPCRQAMVREGGREAHR